jgi:hypothetical protein
MILTMKLIAAGLLRRQINTCGFKCFDPSGSATRKLVIQMLLITVLPAYTDTHDVAGII